MSFENWVTQLSEQLPNYTSRVYILAFFLFWILLSTVLIFVTGRKKKIYKYTYLISTIILLIISSVVYFLDNSIFEKISFDNKIYILLPLIISSFTFLLKYLLLLFKRTKIYRIIFFSEILLITTLIILLILISLFSRPSVYVESSSKSHILETTDTITLRFSSPQKSKDLRINIYPENNVEYEVEYFLGFTDLIEKIKIIPLESFLPEQKIIIYTTGIERIFPYGFKHENSQEFFTPRAPEIEEVVLGVDIENVPVEQPITLDLDTKDQNFVEWEAVFIPQAEYEIKRDLGNTVVIQPKKLKQGTNYELQVIKSIIRYNPLTLEKISTESEEIVQKILFKTAPAPGIESFNRSSGVLSNTTPLIINFKEPLDETTLENHWEINPKVEGIVSLSSDKKQFIFKPNTSFEKNTEYKFTVKSGLENSVGGYIENDIVLTFKTPGVVALSYISPRNSSQDIAISTKNISVTFNQPVDKKSVESKFSISPNIGGSFSWSNNTMYYNFASSLQYGTKYTAKISSGIKALYGLDSTKDITSSFITKYETFLLNVPLYYQSESFTCNLAATRMVLAFKGISSSEGAIRDSIGIGENPDSSWVDKYGVHAGPISSYISSRGVNNQRKNGWNLTDLLSEVKKGNPVIIYEYNGYTQPKGTFSLTGEFTGYKGMHSEVVIGYVGTPEKPIKVITNDPWRGRRYILTGSFLGTWSYLNNTAIVIY